MSAFSERRVQDVQKLKELERQSRNRIRVLRVSGEPPSDLEIELHFKTAPSKKYPASVQEVTKVSISLPSRYPFVPPAAIIKTPILHPNVFPSGQICLGIKWVTSFGLDLLVRRIAQIITFDPSILNESSPANGAALEWYRQARRSNPAAFPTDTLALAADEPQKKISWADVSAAQSKSLVTCPSCNAKLRLPSGKSGRVKCPTCANTFETAT